MFVKDSLNQRQHFFITMDDERVFGAIDALTESDDDTCEAGKPSQPSQSAEPSQPSQSAKRARSMSSPRVDISSEASIRQMLGKPDCHCKQACLSQFTSRSAFEELLAFRRDWAGLHKIDQDAVESFSVLSQLFPEVIVGNRIYNHFISFRSIL